MYDFATEDRDLRGVLFGTYEAIFLGMLMFVRVSNEYLENRGGIVLDTGYKISELS